MKSKVQVSVILVAVIAFILIAFVIVPSIRIIPTGEIGVVRRFGEVQREPLQPGLNFRMAFINTVDRYNVLIQEEDITFSALTLDGQRVDGHISIQYRLSPGRIVDIAHEHGQMRDLQGLLNSLFQHETQNVFATRPAMQLVEERYAIAQMVRERLDAVVSGFHVTITLVALESLSFGEDFEQIIERVAVAEREIVYADGQRERDLIYADRSYQMADYEARTMERLAQADAEIIEILAAADAEALRIMFAAWGDEADPVVVREIMLRQMAITQWDGILPNVVGGNDFGLILNELAGSNPSPANPAQPIIQTPPATQSD